MIELLRGMVIDVNLNPAQGSEHRKIRPCIVITNNTYNALVPVIQVIPLTSWSDRKAAIITNVVIEPEDFNGLEKKSIADCLQVRPIDRRRRLVRIRGILHPATLAEINTALRLVFEI